MGRLWNTDINILFSSIAKMKEMPACSTILDVPCGGGVAFRGIPTDREISYYAVGLDAYDSITTVWVHGVATERESLAAPAAK